jgi:hypothetical protein
MSMLMNRLSGQQCLLIENLTGNTKYGRADCSKGETRALRKLGILHGMRMELTVEADDLLTGKTEPRYWPRDRGDE